MYTEQAMERFKNPKNAGSLAGADAKGEIGNAACGDIMKLYLKVGKGEVIENAKFKTFGCVAAIISTDAVCDILKGKTLEQALQITNKDVLDVIGEVPPQKVHCSVMASEVIGAAVADYRKKQEKEKKAKAKK